MGLPFLSVPSIYVSGLLVLFSGLPVPVSGLPFPWGFPQQN